MFIRFDMIYERDRRTPHDAIAALMHSIARQKSIVAHGKLNVPRNYLTFGALHEMLSTHRSTFV